MNREDETESDLDERVRKAIEASEKAAADYRRAVSEATKAIERLESAAPSAGDGQNAK